MIRLFDLIDADGSGEVELAEFSKMFSQDEPLNIASRMAWFRRKHAMLTNAGAQAPKPPAGSSGGAFRRRPMSAR